MNWGLKIVNAVIIYLNDVCKHKNLNFRQPYIDEVNLQRRVLPSDEFDGRA